MLLGAADPRISVSRQKQQRMTLVFPVTATFFYSDSMPKLSFPHNDKNREPILPFVRVYLSFFLGLMLEVWPHDFFLQLTALGWSLA